MAQGDVKVRTNLKREIVLALGLTAANGAPATAEDGVPCYPTVREMAYGATDVGAFSLQPLSKTRLCVKGTANPGETMGATLVLWGYLETAADWFPIPVNEGDAVAGVGAAKLAYTELLEYLSHFDRLYLELKSPTGAGASFSAYLVSAMESF